MFERLSQGTGAAGWSQLDGEAPAEEGEEIKRAAANGAVLLLSAEQQRNNLDSQPSR